MKSVFIALLTATSVAAGSLRVKPEIVACPKKEGGEQGRVLDCKKVTIKPGLSSPKDKAEYCNKFWTFNCDGADGDCDTLNPRVCFPSGKHRTKCALLKSSAKDGKYPTCKATEKQIKDLVFDFESDDTYDNWFAGACEDGGSNIKFTTDADAEAVVDGCAEAKKAKERRRRWIMTGEW